MKEPKDRVFYNGVFDKERDPELYAWAKTSVNKCADIRAALLFWLHYRELLSPEKVEAVLTLADVNWEAWFTRLEQAIANGGGNTPPEQAAASFDGMFG